MTGTYIFSKLFCFFQLLHRIQPNQHSEFGVYRGRARAQPPTGSTSCRCVYSNHATMAGRWLLILCVTFLPSVRGLTARYAHPLCLVGKYLRLKRIDFQLPYDVLWLWRHNQVHFTTTTTTTTTGASRWAGHVGLSQ